MTTRPPVEELVDRIVQSAFVTTAVLNRLAAEADLSLTQLRVLGILRDHRPTMSELAAHLGLEKSTVTGLIARAEARGLVRRAAHDRDARVVEVGISAEGARLIDGLYVRMAQELEPMTQRLAPPERRRLATLLTTLFGGPPAGSVGPQEGAPAGSAT